MPNAAVRAAATGLPAANAAASVAVDTISAAAGRIDTIGTILSLLVRDGDDLEAYIVNYFGEDLLRTSSEICAELAVFRPFIKGLKS